MKLLLALAFQACTSEAFQTLVSSNGLCQRSSSSLRALLDNEEIEKMKEQAQKLREEIEAFQKSKDDLEEDERKKQQDELDIKREYMDRYSATVPILKMDGSTQEELVQFPPIYKPESEGGPLSTIHVIQAPLPLGVILGESEETPGLAIVDDIAEGSNSMAAGVQIGDYVRACTACRLEMDTSQTWQLLVGGIGQPKTVRFMFECNQPLEQVLEAVASNRMDPEGRAVVLVLERPPTDQ